VSFNPTSVPAKGHVNPLNGLSRVTNVTDRQTDHAMKKCVGIGEIACAARANPTNKIEANNQRIKFKRATLTH